MDDLATDCGASFEATVFLSHFNDLPDLRWRERQDFSHPCPMRAARTEIGQGLRVGLMAVAGLERYFSHLRFLGRRIGRETELVGSRQGVRSFAHPERQDFSHPSRGSEPSLETDLGSGSTPIMWINLWIILLQTRADWEKSRRIREKSRRDSIYTGRSPDTCY